MICFKPVQVSTALPYYRRPTTIKVASNLTRRVHFYWSVADVGEARTATSFGGRRILTSWGVTLFYPTGAEQLKL